MVNWGYPACGICAALGLLCITSSFFVNDQSGSADSHFVNSVSTQSPTVVRPSQNTEEKKVRTETDNARQNYPKYLNYLEGMWTPVKTVGLEEYLEAENGPLWYQQIAKSKLGAPDIEFARIGTYEFAFIVRIGIIFNKSFPFYLDRSFEQDSILGDTVVTYPRIKKNHLSFKITGSRAGLTRNKIEIKDKDFLILTSTLVDKNVTFQRTFERIALDPTES